jgi:hypothetical protein
MKQEIEFIHSRLMAMPEAQEWTPQKSDWAFLALAQDTNLQQIAVKYWVDDFTLAPKYLSEIDTAIRTKFDLTSEMAG